MVISHKEYNRRQAVKKALKHKQEMSRIDVFCGSCGEYHKITEMEKRRVADYYGYFCPVTPHLRLLRVHDQSGRQTTRRTTMKELKVLESMEIHCIDCCKWHCISYLRVEDSDEVPHTRFLCPDNPHAYTDDDPSPVVCTIKATPEITQADIRRWFLGLVGRE